MKSYNGFSGLQREKVFDILKYLRDKGETSWEDKECEMCGCSTGMIMAHSENYFDWLNFNILCVECHLKLHGRFKVWSSWVDYLIKIRNGYKSKGYNSVISYFGTKENRMYFVKKELQLFKPQSNCWWENLKDYQPNIFQEEIDKGNYSETFIEDSWKKMRKEQRKLIADKS
jgi:hypothetical protein